MSPSQEDVDATPEDREALAGALKAGDTETVRRLVALRVHEDFWFCHGVGRDICSQPADDVLTPVLAGLRNGGLSEEAVRRWVLRSFRLSRVADEEPNSLLRFLAAEATTRYPELLAMAKGHDGALRLVAHVTLRCVPERFRLEDFSFENVGVNARLAHDLLRYAKARYEREALALFDLVVKTMGVARDQTEKQYVFDCARLLLAAAPEHAMKAFEIGRGYLAQLSPTDSDLRESAVNWLLSNREVFGTPRVVEALRAHYREPSDAFRLSVFKTLREALGAASVEFLIPGLLEHPVDPKRMSGYLTPTKYAAGILALLSPEELAPFEAQLRKRFKGKTIRALLDVAMGRQAPAAPKRRKPMSGYAFDSYALQTAARALEAIREHAAELPSPIQRLILSAHDPCYEISAVALEGAGRQVELEFDPVPNRLPESSDDLEDDAVMHTLRKRNNLEDEDGPTWGDAFALPESLYWRELILAARGLVDSLRAMGLQVAPTCTASVGGSDDAWSDAEGFERRARQDLRALAGQPLREDVAAVCFDSAEKRAWLLEER